MNKGKSPKKSKCVMVVFGTRPEGIKMAPVIREIRKTQGLTPYVCVTGQHQEMLLPILRFFDITPDRDLNLMRPRQSLADVTSATVAGVDAVLHNIKPDVILVQGDTTTVMSAALAAFYNRIPIGHVEAGLRTNDLYEPWPEEFNRRTVSMLAHHHYAPTESSRKNLLSEGVSDNAIHVTGNTGIDSLLYVRERLASEKGLHERYEKDFSFLDPHRRMILVTAHRRENFGEGLEQICLALRKLVKKNPDIEIVYPVHLNPNVQEPVRRILGTTSNIHLIEPLDYVPFVYLLNRAHLVITDSGGVQEEAPSLGKPVLVMRSKTERPEGVTAGTVKLVGTEHAVIVENASELLRVPIAYESMARAINPYGDGHAAERIVRHLLTL
jgi:UDP-N-acetylglucosamine 2-epimerase (non-hydrolysing)